MIRSPVNHPHLRALAALVAVALAALFLPFAAGPAAAADVQGFEIDGDLIDAPAGGAADWDTRLTAPTLNDQDPSDTTVFSASSKEYNDPSTWTFAGQPPQKDDIGNVYVDTDLVGGHVVLRLAWDRNGTTGTDTYYLELNKSPNLSPAIPSRTAGDLRFGIEEQGNGVLALLDASQWTTAGGGSWQPLPLGMSGFAYAVNAAPVALPAGWTSPWAVGSYEAEQFVETSFDLTALIGLQPGCPPAFGTLNFRNATGGGGGLASNLKDTIAGLEVPAPNTCGTVIVHKDTLPAGSSQTFELDSTLGPAASTNGGLEGKAISDTPTGSVTALDVIPGAYTLTELVPAGWDLTGVVCVDPDAGTTAAGPVVALDVDEYETVTCTYTNTQRGAIVVRKVAVGGNDTFGFTGDITAGLQNGQTATTPNLVPGAYQVAETLTPEQIAAGWYLSEVSCDDADSTGSVAGLSAAYALDPGETVTCTFTNTKKGLIEVEKQTDPAGAGQAFPFTSDVAGWTVGGDGTLVDDEVASIQVVPGTYTVTESTTPSWNLNGIVCADPSGNSSGVTATGVATYNVAAGETVRCVYTNTQQAVITVEKQTVPDGSTQDFAFTPSFPLSAEADNVLRDGQSFSSQGLAPGVYTVTEAVPEGWAPLTAADIVCEITDANGTTTTSSAGAVSIDLKAGAGVRCVFTNTRLGTITVEKLTLPASDTTTEFAFTSDIPAGDGVFEPTLVNGGSATSEPLMPGEYNVAEVVSDDDAWFIDSIVCTDELEAVVFESTDIDESIATIALEPAQDVTCVYLNVAESDLTIVKSNDPTGLVALGSTVTYTLKVGVPEGGGYNQEQIVVTDYIPGYDPAVTGSGTMTYVEGSATCDTGLFPCTVAYDAVAKKLTWTIDEISVGEFRTLTFKATVDRDQASIPSGQSGTVTLKNVAAMDSLFTDPVKSNEVQNTAQIEVAVLPEVIVKTGLAAPLGPIALVGMLLIGTGTLAVVGAWRRTEGEARMTS